MQSNNPVTRLVSRLPTLYGCLLSILFLLLFLRALGKICDAFDCLVYHLPFALMHYDLTTFNPLSTMVDIYASFPPLAHYLQGLLILVTGYLPSSNLIGLLAFGIILISASRLFQKFNMLIFLSLSLSVPLLVIHLSSGYNDLFTACWVFLNFVSLIAYLTDGKKNLNPSSCLTVFILSLAAGMLSKYQAWPFLTINCIVMGLSLLFDRRLEKKQKFFFILLMMIASSFWPGRNFIIYHNPTHPLRPPIIGTIFGIQGTDTTNVLAQQPRYLHGTGTARKFIESALELNRWQTDASLAYSLDQGVVGGMESPHFRMGGWSTFTVFLLLVGVLQVSLRDRGLRIAVGLLTLYLALLLMIPQSHELRYWLFIPMIMAFIISSSVITKNPLVRLLVLGNFAWHSGQLYQFYKPEFKPLESLYPSEAIAYATQRKAQSNFDPKAMECIKDRLPYTIFWSGKNFNEVAVKDCTF